MRKEIKEELEKYKESIRFASGLRTFPNGKKMDIFDATSLNQLGKLLENLYLFLNDLTERKKPKKLLEIIGNCDARLLKERHKDFPIEMDSRIGFS